jgi:hypothetical protein
MIITAAAAAATAATATATATTSATHLYWHVQIHLPYVPSNMGIVQGLFRINSSASIIAEMLTSLK